MRKEGEVGVITKEDRKIIEAEIDRLDKRYEEAHELYGITGSASTERTMNKYDTLKNALENYIYNRTDESHERTITRQWDQLKRLKDFVEKHRIDMAPEVYVELIKIIREA